LKNLAFHLLKKRWTKEKETDRHKKRHEKTKEKKRRREKMKK